MTTDPHRGRFLGLLVGAVLLIAVSGCRGGEDTAAPAPRPTASSASASIAPAFTESETCRKQMRPLVDVMKANRANGLDIDTFDARVQRLTDRIDGALLACSSAVQAPARRVMYEFTAALLNWNLCDAQDCIEPVTAKIKKGLVFADRVDTALAATA